MCHFFIKMFLTPKYVFTLMAGVFGELPNVYYVRVFLVEAIHILLSLLLPVVWIRLFIRVCSDALMRRNKKLSV